MKDALPELPEETRQDLEAVLREELRSGFGLVAEIPARAMDALSDQEVAEDVLAAHIELGLARELAIYDHEKAGWPAVTDCDRLDAAFAALERKGIVARQNFTCCQTCGLSEIDDELAAAGESGPVRGFVFFHQQDTAGAVEEGSLYLSYGSAEKTEESQTAVGHEIVAALVAQGLSPSWNGDTNTRIHLTLDWKRRRPEDAPQQPANASAAPPRTRSFFRRLFGKAPR